MKDDDNWISFALTPRPVFATFLRGCNAMAKCRNDILRSQANMFAAALNLNDSLRSAWVGDGIVEQVQSSQERSLREYSEIVQKQTRQVLQLWFGAWNSLSEIWEPLAIEETLFPLSVDVTPNPPTAEGSARVKRSPKHNGDFDGDASRASAA